MVTAYIASDDGYAQLKLTHRHAHTYLIDHP